ncbi:MAG: alpha/beta hydrolase fold domain-containing protein, partial [Solirubrobacterales bacterium]|nr:alpha/beta hydrolase fold domain-containing protein [Solirubrobacterales bacterium]
MSALVATAAIALPGCGEDRATEPAPPPASIQWTTPARPIPGLTQRLVGTGPRGAAVLWPAGGKPPRDVIVFFHGWLPGPPSSESEWLRHLAMEGNTIVYPVYQTARGRPEGFRANALAGIRAGLRAVDADPDRVVAIGRTTGGALAFDYAAVARSHGLPTPSAVLAVFPGRNPGNGLVTPADLSRIPSQTRLAVIAGPGDSIPDGAAQARALLRSATRVPAGRRAYLT